MQPYLLPYIGYFRLLSAVDHFVVYDNIQYTKRGWINRNRLLSSGEAATFTVPLQKDSDYLDIRQRDIAESFNPRKLLGQFAGAYRKAPFFSQTFELLEKIFQCEEKNLFEFLYHSLEITCLHLNLDTPLIVSSQINADHGAAGQSRLISICNAMKADVYINPIGGNHLYSREAFAANGIDLQFLQYADTEYPQFALPFVPRLSIIDALMFNSVDDVCLQIASGGICV